MRIVLILLDPDEEKFYAEGAEEVEEEIEKLSAITRIEMRRFIVKKYKQKGSKDGLKQRFDEILETINGRGSLLEEFDDEIFSALVEIGILTPTRFFLLSKIMEITQSSFVQTRGLLFISYCDDFDMRCT